VVLKEHLACPQCGYDLHGIVEVRCPECGFRYDAAALRSTAASAAWIRVISAKSVTVCAAIAFALAGPVICVRLGASGWIQLCAIAIAYLVAFATWLAHSEAYRGPASTPVLIVIFASGGLAWRLLFVFPPLVPLSLSLLLLLWAWLIRLRQWPAIPVLGNVEPADLRHSAVRYSVVSTTCLVVASCALLLAWVL
jgi:hypothetical protein